MRKYVAAAVLAAIASVALISTAGARDIPVTLNLIAHQTAGHPVGHNRFVVTGPLLKAGDRSHQKGHFKAVFNRNGRGRAVAYLHNGKIKVDNSGHGNGTSSNVFAIIGGTRHWAGVTGTMRAHQINNRNTLLNFHVK
jgi:hypothetical protein